MSRDEIIEAGDAAISQHFRDADANRQPDGTLLISSWTAAKAAYDAMEPLIRAQIAADNDREWCSIIEAATERPDDVTFTAAVMAAIRADERRKVATEIAAELERRSGISWPSFAVAAKIAREAGTR